MERLRRLHRLAMDKKYRYVTIEVLVEYEPDKGETWQGQLPEHTRVESVTVEYDHDPEAG